MKCLAVWVMAMGTAVASGGCLLISVNKQDSRQPPQVIYVPTTGPAASATDIEARIQAASQISAFPDRDKALARVATDAAGASQSAMAKQALSKITDFTVKDRAAETCATILAARGMRAEALDIAKSITDFTIRDRTLSKLATS